MQRFEDHLVLGQQIIATMHMSATMKKRGGDRRGLDGWVGMGGSVGG